MNVDVDNYKDYLENKLLIIKDNMRKLEIENSTDTDKYYRLQIQKETLENVRDIFYKLCSPRKSSEKRNCIKSIEFISTLYPTEESMYPVVVAKYNGKYYLLKTYAVVNDSVTRVREITTMEEFIRHFNELKEES